MPTIPALCLNTSVRKISLKPAKTIQSVFAYSRNAKLKRKLLPGTCLIVRQNRRSRFQKRISATSETRRIRPFVIEGVLLGKPSNIDRPQPTQ